jgi:hypothetical protein
MSATCLTAYVTLTHKKKVFRKLFEFFNLLKSLMMRKREKAKRSTRRTNKASSFLLEVLRKVSIFYRLFWQKFWS